MTMSCPDCGAEMVPRSTWLSSEYRQLKYTRHVQADVCLSCGLAVVDGNSMLLDETRLDEFKSRVDEWLGPEIFGGVEIQDSADD